MMCLKVIMNRLNRGKSCWQIVGTFTGKTHFMIYCAMYRSQVHIFRQVIAAVDPKAFVIIGEGRQALGEGFMPWEKNLRNSV